MKRTGPTREALHGRFSPIRRNTFPPTPCPVVGIASEDSILVVFKIWIWMYIDPVRVEDEDGSEEEDEEGCRSVNQSDRCSSLQFVIYTL